MKLVLISFCVTLVVAGPTKQSHVLDKKQVDQLIEGLDFDYIKQDPGYSAEYAEAPVPLAQPRPKTGFSVGGGLVSIAQGAANAAHNSVVNQPSAAGQAAYVAKNTLAQAAAQSAATAAAALAGKQIILMGLEQQSYNAHQAVNSEKTQLQQAQRSATAAQNSAQQAMHQVQIITTALNAAQVTSEHAAQASAEAAAELAAQTTMLGQAKASARAIDEQLEAARVDFEATQAAAQKAAALAQKAQSNAAAAAAHAAQAASEAAAQAVATKNDHEALQNTIQNSVKMHPFAKFLIRDSINVQPNSVAQDAGPVDQSGPLNGPGSEENYSTNSYETASPYTTSAIAPSSYPSSTSLDYDYKSSPRVLDYGY
ncbi:uncharacterized protein LOC122511270 [Leptopilina heterotoma]|uniref:uncharacterized protein LOC122511270 n=1 Tax=Leptopilina heterotoma TaxID=63436 RepID=UPI001CA9CF79|nr:uncharacterized protein LOC122511270 [Leptopilina heterotoma]XP_043482351.1 uncharacterized protein LOC122511270 [Leptopilina heterotoma]